MLSPRRDALVLFDEAEDAFPHASPFAELFGLRSRAASGKGWMNRTLETHPVSTIWVANEIAQLDPAFLRRFDAIVELRAPPPGVRRRVLDRHLGDLPARADWRDRAAQDERLAPAHVGRAARAVRLLGARSAEATEAALDRLLAPQLAVVGTPRRSAPLSCGAYDLSVVNASMALEPLIAALAARPRGTLCLYGPPGTGKSAFASHLAERAGRPLRVKRASDLLGMYVGQTEKAIAAMFREARDDGAILFLDEADSFLQDRSRAVRSWEVTQVNELLVQMEQHDGLFLCATNLLESLDQASLRRFAVKVRFDPLREDQRWQVLCAVLGDLAAPPPGDLETHRLRGRLARLDGVTVGDFAAVSRQHHILAGRATPESVVAALEEEVRIKRTTSSRLVGFRQQP